MSPYCTTGASAKSNQNTLLIYSLQSLNAWKQNDKQSLIFRHSFVAWLPQPMLVLQIRRPKGLSATVLLAQRYMHTHFVQEHFKFLKLAFVPIQPMIIPSFVCTTQVLMRCYHHHHTVLTFVLQDLAVYAPCAVLPCPKQMAISY